MRHEGGGAEGHRKGLIPTEVANLKRELANVSATWRRRTHASRLSARRWIQREDHVDRRAPWRKRIAGVLESTWFHVAVVVLLAVDLTAVAIDILKTIHIKSADLNDCVALVEACTSCVGHFERREEWKWSYWISIVILGLLLLNVFGLIVAFGRAFFLHPLYVLDLIVVSTALGLEIGLHTDTAGVIIVITLWRIVRVAHGIFEVTDEAWEKDIHRLESQVQVVQSACDKEQELLAEKDRRIAELEAQLNGQGS
ncbi:hypothetical protein M758_4G090900 [Ceratodon purpureus]|nr:hypothetical protein M758_4G090900 [Ceratodon purpureus]